MGHVLRFIIVLSCLSLLLGCAQETEDTTPPAAPTNLTKITPDHDQWPTFTWEAADDGSEVSYHMVSIDGLRLEDTGNMTTYTYTDEMPLSNGSHTFLVTVIDKAGRASATAKLTFTIAHSMVISAVSAAVAADRYSVTITWVTNEPATSQVEYGPTTSYGSISALDSSFVTSHNVKLTGLITRDTSYHYRVTSVDCCGNSTSSPDFSFGTFPVTLAR